MKRKKIGYDLIEVRSSTKVKDEFIYELLLQNMYVKKLV